MSKGNRDGWSVWRTPQGTLTLVPGDDPSLYLAAWLWLGWTAGTRRDGLRLLREIKRGFTDAPRASR